MAGDKNKLTEKQRQILEYLKQEILQRGFPPSVREICEAVSLRSTSSVHAHLETLRVLKKGGTFAIHDLMSPRRYGDMQAFVQKLRDMGYECVELIDTTDGSFMTPKEAKRLMLRGSTLLVGRK